MGKDPFCKLALTFTLKFPKLLRSQVDHSKMIQLLSDYDFDPSGTGSTTKALSKTAWMRETISKEF